MGPFFDANVPVIFYGRQSRRAFFPSNVSRPEPVIPAEDTALWEVRNQEKVCPQAWGLTRSPVSATLQKEEEREKTKKCLKHNMKRR